MKRSVFGSTGFSLWGLVTAANALVARTVRDCKSSLPKEILRVSALLA